jgi:hypothetical protein
MSARPTRSRYPSVGAYAATLPEGWSSWPEFQVRASLVIGLRDRGAFEGLEDLPDEITGRVRSLTNEAGWLPEVLSVGVFLAVRDARFGGPSGELDFLAWIDALNGEILQVEQTSRDIRSPADAVRWIPDVWSRFHRGSTMRVVARTEESAEIAFAHPPFLFPGAWMESRRRTLRSALARAGAVQPEVHAERDGERGTRFRLSWR